MKKILVVGGGVNQLPLILAAKGEGYHVIVVDMAGENCPAYSIADGFYAVSTQDEAAILEVARKEKIDGIVSNSEPSMLIVNKVAAELKLVGNPVDGVENLISKSKFRSLQKKVGVFAPECQEVTSSEDAVSVAQKLRYPIIIKPCESSGSRGCKKLDEFDEYAVTKAFQECSHISRNKKVVIEEFVAMPSLRTIEGDIFVLGDTILWDGLFYTTRAKWAPMVPMTYTAPILIDCSQLDSIKSAISRIIKASDIQFGEFNIEGFFTATGEFFIIEINARQGGNFLPAFLHRFTGIDYYRLLVTTCVTDDYYLAEITTSERSFRYAVLDSAYSQHEGIYKGLKLNPLIIDKITNITELYSVGDRVEKCVDGTGIVASVALEFDSLQELYDYSPLIIDCIQVDVSSV